jgi:phosphatidylserine/phosphatidylglycerophosphate/cardiolipin synthase-like enzyme
VAPVSIDNRSLALNDEATLMVLDEHIGEQMTSIFLDDLRHSEEIVMAQFGRRWWIERVAEDTSNTLERLL